jgi:phospholipase C
MKDLDKHLFEDLKTGNVADFVWLQPRMTTVGGTKLPSWQHPDASVLEGEKLIKQVYEAIRSSPVWEETLFIITYDEHGGFYDHVNPPGKLKAGR